MLRITALLFIAVSFCHCGEVGIALNISREQPVKIHFDKKIDTLAAFLNIHEQASYSLDDVKEFGDYLPKLDELGNVNFNQFAYSFDSLEGLEQEVHIELFKIQMINESDTLLIYNQSNSSLSNLAKQLIDLNQNDITLLQEWLFDRKTITTDIAFVLSDFPQGLDSLEFDITAYFDATLKIRNLKL